MSSELFGGPIAQAIGWSLLHLVWEATIVAGILAAVLALMARRSANARYVVSCAALALLPVMALITAVRAYDAPLASNGGQAPSPVRTGEAPVLHSFAARNS
jgi:bla regulator protein blaR1